MLAQLVLKAITLRGDTGLIVDGIICDGAATNKKMWKELGINGSKDKLKNYFIHSLDESRKIFAFSDLVHIFKCVRNRLYNNTSLCVSINIILLEIPCYKIVRNCNTQLMVLATS